MFVGGQISPRCHARCLLKNFSSTVGRVHCCGCKPLPLSLLTRNIDTVRKAQPTKRSSDMRRGCAMAMQLT